MRTSRSRTSARTSTRRVLFKCEDERYELNLIIELNSSAIRTLEPIKQKLAGLTEEDAETFKMEALDRTYIFIYYFLKRQFSFNSFHVQLLIYLQHFMRGRLRGSMVTREWRFSKASTLIPRSLYQRLKQKNFEWHKSKQEWDKVI